MNAARMLLTAAALISASPALADSWAMPTPTTIVSPAGTMRATIIPRPMTSQIEYFEDKVARREPAGGVSGSAARTAVARIERKEAGGWTFLREQPLLNEVAPVVALVSDTGFVATLDNWHSVGFGEHVLAIYRPDGSVVRSFALPDLLPDTYTAGLPHSVSSLHWRRGLRLSPDQHRLIIDVALPEESREQFESHKTLPLEIELATARVLPRDPATWRDAEAAASRVAAARRQWEEEARAFRRNPLLAPTSQEEQDWHAYLREAFARTDPQWCDPDTCEDRSSTDTIVLRPRSATEYRASEKWVAEALTEPALHPDLTTVRSIGSPDEVNLAAVVERLAKRVKPGQLRSVQLYIVASAASGERIRRSLAHSGAVIIIVDPAVPIPQRPQVLARLDTQAATAAR
jgi:hypothetical protein